DLYVTGVQTCALPICYPADGAEILAIRGRQGFLYRLEGNWPAVARNNFPPSLSLPHARRRDQPRRDRSIVLEQRATRLRMPRGQALVAAIPAASHREV